MLFSKLNEIWIVLIHLNLIFFWIIDSCIHDHLFNHLY